MSVSVTFEYWDLNSTSPNPSLSPVRLSWPLRRGSYQVGSPVISTPECDQKIVPALPWILITYLAPALSYKLQPSRWEFVCLHWWPHCVSCGEREMSRTVIMLFLQMLPKQCPAECVFNSHNPPVRSLTEWCAVLYNIFHDKLNSPELFARWVWSAPHWCLGFPWSCCLSPFIIPVHSVNC